VFKTAHQRL
jgi:hypothetical protein